MKKRTIIISHIDLNDNTAFVQNMGINELSLFNRLKDNGIELNDDNISDNEICMLLNHLCTDGIIEGVFSIQNSFNRDQAEINIVKHNIEERLKAKGLAIVPHSKWTPSFSEYDITNTVINNRNYLTLLVENISDKEKKVKELDNKVKELDYKIKEYELKLINKQDDLNQLVKRFKNGESYIAKNNETISNITNSITEKNKMLDNINNSIIEKVYAVLNHINDDYLTEAKEKFMRTVKMYIINGRNLPEFEKEYAKELGLDDNTINSIISIITNKV